jgi:DNA invertase Pin-like site-specific DNA recombinase
MHISFDRLLHGVCFLQRIKRVDCMTELASAPLLMRGAQYVRMSTEHQQYSTQNQADKILEYARSRGIKIVRTYADEGKSGLSIGGRNALQQLISDVQNKTADFKVILVYDVSR